MTLDKLAYIQKGDEVGYYSGKTKLYGKVVEIIAQETRLRVEDLQTQGLVTSVVLEAVFERSRVIPGQATETHSFIE